jgi:FkbM family methyltransferase
MIRRVLWACGLKVASAARMDRAEGRLNRAESQLRELQPDVADLAARLTALAEKTDVADLAARLTALAEKTPQRPSIDFIRHGELGVFVPQDSLYDYQAADVKNQSVDEFVRRRRTTANLPSDCVDYWVDHAIRHCVSAGERPVILDIGGHVGLFSLEAAHLMRARHATGRIVCFEPGPTGPLIEASVAVNELQDLIEVRRTAISDRTGPALFYKHDYYSQANALLRHMHHTYAELARTTDVRDILTEFAGADTLLVKIDTEGMEERIVRAAEAQLDPTRSFLQLEFGVDPHPRQVILGFLTYLNQRYALFDLPRRQRLTATDFPMLVDGLKDRPAGFTDILCSPLNHPVTANLWPRATTTAAA